jgi:hypothetical protein
MEPQMLDAPADQVLTVLVVGIILFVSAMPLILPTVPAFRRFIGEA